MQREREPKGLASARSAADTPNDAALFVDLDLESAGTSWRRGGTSRGDLRCDDMSAHTVDRLGARVSTTGAAHESVELITKAISTPDIDASFIALGLGRAEQLHCLLLRATGEDHHSADGFGHFGAVAGQGEELVEDHRSGARGDEARVVVLRSADLGAPIAYFDDADTEQLMHGDEVGSVERHFGLDVDGPAVVELCKGLCSRHFGFVERLRQLVELVQRGAKQGHEPVIDGISSNLEESTTVDQPDGLNRRPSPSTVTYTAAAA